MQINLISDTVTKPSKGMLEAMMNAQVGDDVFKADPTINQLEEHVAELFGMDSALFFPSGTMANQCAIKAHTQPGDQLICDKYAHVYNYEGGGVAFNSGVTCSLVDGHRGMITAEQVNAAINPYDFYHSPKSALVCLENTTNKGGGACWNIDEMKQIRKLCDENELGFHLDGARLWNALTAKSESPEQYGKLFDTISVCFSKGLGCPVGSVLVGEDALIEKAFRVRKVLGGGMRQSGYLAAACLYALEHNVKRLEEDHQKAKEIGTLLSSLDFISNVEPVETNIIIFNLDASIDDQFFLETLAQRGIAIIGMGQGKLRMVTHMDYTEEMHRHVLETLKSLEIKKASR